MMKFNLPWLLIAGRQVMVDATTGVSIGKYLFRGRFTGRGFNITADLGEADVAFTVESPNRQPYVSDRYALEGGPNTYTVNFGDGGIDSFNNDMKRNFPEILLEASDLARLSQNSLFALKLRTPIGEFDRQALTLSEGRGRYVYNDGDGFRLTLTVSRRRLRMRVDCTTPRRRQRITRRFKAEPADDFTNTHFLSDFEAYRELTERVTRTCMSNALPITSDGILFYIATENRVYMLVDGFPRPDKVLTFDKPE